MTGFGTPVLSPEAKRVLACFRRGAIAWPNCSLAPETVDRALVELKQKQLVAGARPYRLTKKGRRLYKELTAEG